MKKVFNNNFSAAVLTLMLAFFAFSCQNDTTKNDAPAEEVLNNEASTALTQETTPTEAATTELEEVAANITKEVLYPWVDKLNIRDAPNLVGNTIATVTRKDALAFIGEQSEKSEEIVLRGVAYDAHWLKVITPDKKEGWVFSGAVTQKGEKKGTAPLTDKKFSFPHFGDFDLATWKNLGTKTEGDEVDRSTTTYQKRNEILEVVSSEMGEFHYEYNYKLMDGQKKILMTRVFSFAAAPDGSGNEISETVTDLMANKIYTRKQNLRTHFYQLNAKPQLVNGPWSESDLVATVVQPTPLPEDEE